MEDLKELIQRYKKERKEGRNIDNAPLGFIEEIALKQLGIGDNLYYYCFVEEYNENGKQWQRDIGVVLMKRSGDRRNECFLSAAMVSVLKYAPNPNNIFCLCSNKGLIFPKEHENWSYQVLPFILDQTKGLEPLPVVPGHTSDWYIVDPVSMRVHTNWRR